MVWQPEYFVAQYGKPNEYFQTLNKHKIFKLALQEYEIYSQQ